MPPAPDSPQAGFRRPEHHAVLRVLQAMDPHFLAGCRCWFGGGTSIVLALGEYRLSRDVDFLCADEAGYRELRTVVFHEGTRALFVPPIQEVRPVRADRYGIRGVVSADGAPIRFEIGSVGNGGLEEGVAHPVVPVRCLSPTDRAAQKLLANADRCRDPASNLRDAIDLGMLAARAGPLPDASVRKAVAAYGDVVGRQAAWAARALQDPAKRAKVAATLGMAATDAEEAADALHAECHRIWPDGTRAHDLFPEPPAYRRDTGAEGT